MFCASTVGCAIDFTFQFNWLRDGFTLDQNSTDARFSKDINITYLGWKLGWLLYLLFGVVGSLKIVFMTRWNMFYVLIEHQINVVNSGMCKRSRIWVDFFTWEYDHWSLITDHWSLLIYHWSLISPFSKNFELAALWVPRNRPVLTKQIFFWAPREVLYIMLK